MSLKGEAFALYKGSDGGDSRNTSSSLREVAEPEAKERGGFSISTIASALPTALLTAVVIDAFLDGLLIGISTAIDDTTGSILSASLAVETIFLGITIAAALRGAGGGPNSISVAILLAATALGPAGILAGSLSGGALAPVLVTSPVFLAGLLGFGTSTTLFMVAEELLLEAHEEGGNHIWWVDLQLYTGFFASVMVEKLVGM
jgi:zinc transporter, ZIP family